MHPLTPHLKSLQQLIGPCERIDSGSCAQILAGKLKMPTLAYAAWTAALHDLPVNKQWYLLEPVTFRAEHNGVFLTGNAFESLDHATAHQICDELTALEQDLQWQFFAVSPHQWLLFEQTLGDIETTDLADAVGRDFRDTWPKGVNAGVLQRHLTEWQMWLHTHPLNAQLNPKIQGLWLWGNSATVTPSGFPWQQVYTDAAWCKGLVKQRATAFYDIERFKGVHAHLNTLIWCDALHMPFAQGQSAKWESAFHQIMESVLKPLLSDAFDAFDEIYLHLDDGFSYAKFKRDKWKFWRRALKISVDKAKNASDD